MLDQQLMEKLLALLFCCSLVMWDLALVDPEGRFIPSCPFPLETPSEGAVEYSRWVEKEISGLITDMSGVY